MSEPATQAAGGKDGGGVSVVVGMTMPPEPNWSPEVREIGDQIANLTLREAVLLSQYLEEVHGIKPSGGVQIQQDYIPPPPKDAVPEQTEFSVIFDGFEADKKIAVIKTFREITGMALKEAKDWIESGAGKAIKDGLAHGEALILKQKMESSGAKVTVK